MFNLSNTDTNPDIVWKLLGTFFESLPELAKRKFENYWEAQSKTTEGAYYSLYQSDLIQYFKFMKGAHELLYQKFKIITHDLNTDGRDLTNVTKVFLESPENVSVTKGDVGTGVYSYRISALNSKGESIASEEVYVTEAESPDTSAISVSWDAVTGADSYNVYGRSIKNHKLLGNTASTSFSDDSLSFSNGSEGPKSAPTAETYYLYKLPGDYIHMSVPELVEESSETTLTEGTEYSVQDLSYLKLDASQVTLKTDLGRNIKYNDYSAKTIITLSPILNQFYFKIFGKSNPITLLENLKYQPHLKGFSGLSYKDKRIKYAEHLRFWTWGYSYHLRKAPTLSNIKKLYGFAQDYPFAYEDGTVTDVTNEFLTVSGESVYEYDIGSGNTHVFSNGNSVKRFDLLCEGITVDDYYTDSTKINGLVTSEEEPRLTVNLNNAVNFSPDTEIIETFKKIAIPAGILLKETTN